MEDILTKAIPEEGVFFPTWGCVWRLTTGLGILWLALEELISVLAFLATSSEDTVIISIIERSHEKTLLVLNRKQAILCIVHVV